ncbi:MAG: phosphomannomutase, partial [Planctomycetota bacterium]
PTRDAIILHLCIILLARKENRKLSEITADLPERYTKSDRLKNFPQEDSKYILDLFNSGIEEKDRAKATDIFGKLCGVCSDINRTDGIRMTFDSDEIVHLRPSGNAPEFRCYNEAAAEDRVVKLNSECMKILTNLVQYPKSI